MSPNAEASGTVRKARKKFDAWHGVPDDVSNIRNKNPTTKKKYLTLIETKLTSSTMKIT